MSSKRVEIIDKRDVFEQYRFRIEEARLRHERRDGQMSEPITRLCFVRGDSVAALLHDPHMDTLVLTDQFRYPTYEKGPGWLLEIPAGSIEPGESPEVTLRRELVEETGYQVQTIRHISTFYVSPGGTSERIFLFYAAVIPTDRIGAGGGVAHEHEDIQVVTMKVAEVLAKLHSGEIADAKTIIGLQWLQLNKTGLG